jgi:hypothetical protein
VAELLAARPGISERSIAREVGCSPATAHADVVAIRTEWAARRGDLYESRVAEDIARSDAAIAALWPHVTAGRGWAIERLVGLLTYRMKVLGLESQRNELDVGAALAELLTRLQGERDAAAAS